MKIFDPKLTGSIEIQSQVSGSIVPTTTEVFDLGSSTNRWNDIYLAGSTIDLGGTKMTKDSSGNIEFKDGSNNRKKIIVEEILVGTGNSQKRIKVDDGKLSMTDKDGNADTQMFGHILPHGHNLYDLGSTTAQWRDLYLSSGSLYIDGTQVLSSDSNILTVTTDTGQSLKLLETGADDITLQTDTGNIELKGTVEILSGKKIIDSAGTRIQFGDSLDIAGSITLTGNVDGIDLQAMSSSLASRISSLDNEYATDAELNAVSASVKSFATSADTTLSSSLAADIKTNDGRLDTLEGKTLISGSAQITSFGALMDSEVTDLSLIKGLTQAKISGSFTAASASLASNVATNNSSITSLNAATSSYLLNTTDTLTGNLTVTGTLTAQQFNTEYVSASILFDSGSTKFGDSSDDLHQFTGSVKIAEGMLYVWNSNVSNYIRIFGGSSGNFIDNYGTDLYIRPGADSTKSVVIYTSGNTEIKKNLTVKGTTTSEGNLTAPKLIMGSTQLYKSGDNNHIHFVGSALIGTSTTASSNPKIGTSTYPFSQVHAGYYYGDGSNLTGRIGLATSASHAEYADNATSATSATSAATATSASSVPYSGLTGTVPTWNQNTTGNAATATTASYIAASNIHGTVATATSASHAEYTDNSNLLDGQDSSYFTNAANLASGTLHNNRLHAKVFVNDGGTFSDGFSSDVDDIVGFRTLRVTGYTGTDHRAFTDHHNMITIPNTSATQYDAQLAFQTGTVNQGGIKFRSSTNGTWSDWYTIWHSGNDGPTSGLAAQTAATATSASFATNSTTSSYALTAASVAGTIQNAQSASHAEYADNAGTLDSLDSSQFLRSDTGDTMTGVLSMTSTSAIPLTVKNGHSSYTAISIANTGSGQAGVYMDASNGDFIGSDYAFVGQTNDKHLLLNVGSSGGDILFEENGSEQMRITGGKVGIGTTSPVQKLQVDGSIYSNGGEIYVNGDKGITAVGNLLFKAHNGSDYFEGMRLTSTGNVGIGETTPLSKLEVAGSIKATNRDTSHTSEAGLTISYDTSNAIGLIETWTSKPLLTRTYNYQAFDISGTEKMRINSTGVGIGTTSPDFELDVAGNIGIDGKIYHNGDHNTYIGFTGDTQTFRTGGTDRVTINNTGVGIGTTSPATTLDVEGGALGSTSGDTKTAAIIRAGRQNIVFKDTRTANDTDWRNATFKIIAQIDSTDHQSIDFVNDNSYYEHIDIRTGNQVFHSRFTHDGKLGIGTTSPSSLLTLNKASGEVGILLEGNGTDVGKFKVASAGVNHAVQIGTISNNEVQFHTNNTERMRIQNGGNVGIGTTSPSTKFHVVGAAVDNESLGLFTNNYSGGGVFHPGLKVVNTHSNHSYGTVAEFRTEDGAGTDRPSILFTNAHADHYWTVGQGGYGANDNFAITYRSAHPNLGGGWGTSRLMIDTSGNVGIGTTSPTKKLHVAGTAAVIGELTIDASGGTDNYYLRLQEGGSDRITVYENSNNVYINGWAGHIIFRPQMSGNGSFAVTQGNTQFDTSGNGTLAGNLTVAGTITAQQFHTEYVSSSILHESGSTSFGNSSDDVHNFTGSLNVQGNISHEGITPTSGTDIDQIKTISKSLTVTTSWSDTGISGSGDAGLATGTYMLQMYTNNHGVGGGHYNEYYSGVMSWYGSNTNDPGEDEIVLHKAGHASNSNHIYLKTVRRYANNGDLKLQIASTATTTGNSTYTFKFRRMI